MAIIYCPDCGKQLIEFEPGSRNYHCANPNCMFQYIEVTTGKQHRKNVKNYEMENKRPVTNLDRKSTQILARLAIENTLLSTGNSIFDKVINRLKKDYNANVLDCFDNPQYLKKVLEEILDNDTFVTIIKSIKIILEEFSYYDSMREFLDELSKKD